MAYRLEAGLCNLLTKIDLRTMTHFKYTPWTTDSTSTFDILFKDFFNASSTFVSPIDQKIGHPVDIYETKEGLQRAREKGVKLGSRDPEKSVKLMNIASVKAKKEFRSKMNPIINELRKNGCKTLKSFADRLNEMKMFTRTGKKWTPGSINNLIYNQ